MYDFIKFKFNLPFIFYDDVETKAQIYYQHDCKEWQTTIEIVNME